MIAQGRSDIGRVRSQNQDTVFVSTEPVGPLPNLFIVADGMGGHKAGEVASRRSVALFCEYISQNTTFVPEDGYLDLMVSAAADANRKIYGYALADPALSGMGTTLTACVVSSGKCQIVHIGDSRAYLLRHGHISQLTTDHSYVGEMVRAGQISPSEAREHPRRNVLIRVLGVDPDMAVDGYMQDLTGNETLLLCSDGLTNMLTDEAIGIVIGADAPLEERANRLIDEANKRGGNDNISVVLIDM